MNKLNLYESVYGAIYEALEEGDYSKEYPIVGGHKLWLCKPDKDGEEPWFEKSVCVKIPTGEREVFTIAYDGRTQRYRIPTFAQLFAGEQDLVGGCADEITEWIIDNK